LDFGDEALFEQESGELVLVVLCEDGVEGVIQ